MNHLDNLFENFSVTEILHNSGDAQIYGIRNNKAYLVWGIVSYLSQIEDSIFNVSRNFKNSRLQAMKIDGGHNYYIESQGNQLYMPKSSSVPIAKYFIFGILQLAN